MMTINLDGVSTAGLAEMSKRLGGANGRTANRDAAVARVTKLLRNEPDDNSLRNLPSLLASANLLADAEILQDAINAAEAQPEVEIEPLPEQMVAERTWPAHGVWAYEDIKMAARAAKAEPMNDEPAEPEPTNEDEPVGEAEAAAKVAADAYWAWELEQAGKPGSAFPSDEPVEPDSEDEPMNDEPEMLDAAEAAAKVAALKAEYEAALELVKMAKAAWQAAKGAAPKASSEPRQPRQPRTDSKAAAVIELMARPEGASGAELKAVAGHRSWPDEGRKAERLGYTFEMTKSAGMPTLYYLIKND